MHIEILVALANAYNEPNYLEIGVGDGGCLEQMARVCSRVVGVDVPENPYTNRHANLIASVDRKCHFYDCGSDEFFANWKDDKFDLIFIDGSHWEEQVERDFANALSVLAPLGTIAMHDTWAANAEDAKHGSDTAWKVAEYLECERCYGNLSLQVFTLPIRPGLTLVRENKHRSYQ